MYFLHLVSAQFILRHREIQQYVLVTKANYFIPNIAEFDYLRHDFKIIFSIVKGKIVY